MGHRSSSTHLDKLPETFERLLAAPEDGKVWNELSRARVDESSALRPERLGLVVAAQRPATGYDDKLRASEQQAAVRRVVAQLLGAMGRRAEVTIPRLVETLREPMQGGCRPECCSASHVRREQVLTRLVVLQQLRRIRVDVGIELDEGLVRALLDKTSGKIALGALELLSQSSDSVKLHGRAIVEALEHPRVRVQEQALRALCRVDSTDVPRALAAATKSLFHERASMRRTAIRAVTALRVGGGERDRVRANERLSRLADRDPDLSVRARACLALGRPTRPLFEGQLGRQ